MKNMKNEGHRERLRNRYLQAGEEGFPDYDLLELLLTYAIHRQDVKPMARDLLAEFQDIGGIMDADPETLCKIKGMGKSSALLFRIIRDLCTRYLESKVHGTDVLNSSAAVRSFARMRLAAYTVEVLLAIYLDIKNQIICSEEISRGTVNAAIVHPRSVVEAALQHRASSVILVHNHPSGMTKPSPSDKKITYDLNDALATVEIRLLDHLIVSRTGVFSFADNNMLTRKILL